ncbi:hypothetical protein [Actimicrobium sp. CCI2.3]|uniref:RipA family octameric membrane protein n=1 Tax=Actimicrobium sp. CCI2.3 TaxID=3048616 RepID=UPI002AB44AB8|nr:hypothetical protein [Actimicrobium sp. CCI2.3]MDY7576189.1 hypothetical protein [Actimicrobium sp. CCI2.3]MEB0020606.1 hypothetical protein [Actimicrobium sp. CCI2.3]
MAIDHSTLWNEIPEGQTYPHNEKWYSHLLDQYKMYVEMADRISQRRTTANSYFLSVNTAILAFVGYLTSKDSVDFLWLLAVAGGTLTILWYSIIIAYRNLNTAKWGVVHEIEKRLPISPYDAEWEAVERGTNSKLYRPISEIEKGVPYVFFFLHCVVFLKSFPWPTVKYWLNC